MRAVGDELLVVVVIMLSKVIMLPRMGKMPVGSGAVRSLNQRKPSVVRAGHSLYEKARRLIKDMQVMWTGNYRIPVNPIIG